MNRHTSRAAGLPPNRLETLADGIFAIAMTLLVLELRLPEPSGSADLASQLAALWPKFATFFISFIVLGVYWFAHHQTFHFLVRVNRTVVWLNILFFMGAALIPFVASVLGTYPQDSVALGLYGLVLGLLATVGYVVWWYITGDRGLIDEKLDPDLVRKVRLWITLGPLVSLGAIGLAFVNPFLTLLVYLALPALFILFNPVDSYLERLRQSEQ
ncbi:MAG TPA: TMEM175 family protein [Thermoplasmata archaeon]|nr:TMEM175 family protein [Thermoplasmata archaeon]